MKFCPNCGAGVEPDAGSCESCGAELTMFSALLSSGPEPPAPPAARLPGRDASRVADLAPGELRREIRWGVFQGILLAGVIVLLVYVAVFLVIAIVVEGVAGVSGIIG
jgi:uncharacterized membrane protein YvbJ